jgi:hypothetical protein
MPSSMKRVLGVVNSPCSIFSPVQLATETEDLLLRTLAKVSVELTCNR